LMNKSCFAMVFTSFFNLEKNKSGLANANPHYMIIVHF